MCSYKYHVVKYDFMLVINFAWIYIIFQQFQPCVASVRQQKCMTDEIVILAQTVKYDQSTTKKIEKIVEDWT